MSLESEIKGLREEFVALTQALRLNTLKEVEGAPTVPTAATAPTHAPTPPPVGVQTPPTVDYDQVKDAFLAHARAVGAPAAREWLEGHGWKTLRDAPAKEYEGLLQELLA